MLAGFFSPNLGKSVNKPRPKLLNVSWDLGCIDYGEFRAAFLHLGATGAR